MVKSDLSKYYTVYANSHFVNAKKMQPRKNNVLHLHPLLQMHAHAFFSHHYSVHKIVQIISKISHITNTVYVLYQRLISFIKQRCLSLIIFVLGLLQRQVLRNLNCKGTVREFTSTKILKIFQNFSFSFGFGFE